ncbi:MAG TPA: formate/nitrite transporter family protein [Gemmatimonadaceae bacterium]|nr:formate/nitrite transporter family protein [Gemmatimonadaceae bacterium]
MGRTESEGALDESGGGDGPRPTSASLDRVEDREARRRTAPRAAVVYEAIRREGEDELGRPTSALFFSGLAAGLSMGFSLVAEGLLRAMLPDAPWRPLVSKLGYSVGFLIVILGRQQLFTENTLTPVLPLLRRQRGVTLAHVLRLWGVVLASNLIGTLVFAWMIGRTDAFDPTVRAVFASLGAEALHAAGPGTIIVRGIFAGWLIALMVWLLPFAETARVWVIVILTYLIGIAQLPHIIAGSVETLYLVTTGAASVGEYLGRFFLPALAGNVIGGLALVTAINHAQVVSGDSGAEA